MTLMWARDVSRGVILALGVLAVVGGVVIALPDHGIPCGTTKDTEFALLGIATALMGSLGTVAAWRRRYRVGWICIGIAAVIYPIAAATSFGCLR